jgi:glycerophosphoryl diester phosphodiesterase
MCSLSPAQTSALKLAAHRGGVVDDRHAENSPGSIEEAVRRGYWMIEVDVRESKDGRLVVHHDADFRRFYDYPKPVADLTWNEISGLRATPGGSRPLEFHELAALCRGRLRLMIDTKPAVRSPQSFAALEKALRDNHLLDSAYIIGTPESKAWFKGKARVAVNRKELREALDRKEDVARLCFFYEPGRGVGEDPIVLARKAGVPVVTAIHTSDYKGMDHMESAAADIQRLRKLGVTCFQIDSVYERLFLLSGEAALGARL